MNGSRRVGCQMGYTGEETVAIPSSRWLMSVVGSLDDRCSPECPGAMRRLDAKSSARCLASFLLACRRSSRGSSLNGGVSYKACRHETSPCPVVGEIPVKAVVSPVVPVAEASFNWCPVLPVNGLLEQDQSPCGRGSIVVCTKRDCSRLVVGPSGCDDVGVDVGDGKAQLVLFRFARCDLTNLVSHVVRYLVSTVEARSPCSCSRRRSKLTWAPAGCSRCRCHGESLQSFVVVDESNRSIFRLRFRLRH